MSEQILRLMEGAYDTHLHASPGISPCRSSILELAREAKSYNMKGIVYKDLHFPTAAQALIVEEAVPGIRVIGGISLSACVGGLNPAAVEATFKLGGKAVWMFTLDSADTIRQVLEPGYPLPAQHYRNLLVDLEHGGYSVFREGSEVLRDEAREIIALCKQYGCVMETSHLSQREASAMIREGKAQGLERMVVTHANQFATLYPLELQKELAAQGALISYCFEAYLAKTSIGAEPLRDLGEKIRQIGVDNVVLGTDMGASFWPSAIEGVRMMIASLLAAKFTEDEISRMIKVNPDRLYAA